MSTLKPRDRRVLVKAVLDSLVVASDPDARRSGLYYWQLARPFTTAVVDAVKNCDNAAIRNLGGRLLEDPADPARYFELESYLAKQDMERPSIAAILEHAWRSECNSRVGYHLGPRYEKEARPVVVDDLTALPAGPRLPVKASPEVLIVVPFRDGDSDGPRLRNLLACLLALRDQSFPREEYEVTVVESDEVARCRDVISQYADHYLFAKKPGAFNKSWAMNAGVVNTPGRFGIVCILDADVLTDRDFVARNVARFLEPGRGGHLTYRNMSCLTATATSWAIRERVQRRAAAAGEDHLRAFQLRGPPGCCVWVRTEIFHRVGGMDERYEGWGGEDNDFADRYDVAAPLGRYDDWMLHMSHPPASLLREDGALVNAHIPPLSWKPETPIGRLDRFSAPAESK